MGRALYIKSHDYEMLTCLLKTNNKQNQPCVTAEEGEVKSQTAVTSLSAQTEICPRAMGSPYHTLCTDASALVYLMGECKDSERKRDA